jgi:hypothetical protein
MVLSWLISIALVVISVVVHYEALRLLAVHVEELKLPFRVRLRMVLVMLAIIVTHVLEILLFALGLFLAARFVGVGDLAGQVEPDMFHDYFYFSLVSYTTLGLGDIYPTGGLQIITGVESLIGLLMITWSASFTFLYMEKFWRLGHGRGGEANCDSLD